MTEAFLDVKTLIKDAKKVLMSRGWCQGEYGSADGRVCAVGAFIVADGVEAPTAGRPEPYLPHRNSINRALDELRAALPDGYDKVYSFNDSPETTLTDVLDLYDRALVHLV